jgi:hypothetical protein
MSSVAPYNGYVPPALSAMLSDFREEGLRAIARARRVHNQGNKCAAFRWTLQWMAARELVFAAFDKESGVCLIKQSSLMAVKRDVLRSNFYEGVTTNAVELQGQFRREYFKLASLVQKLEGGSEQVGHAIRKSMQCDKAWYSGVLLTTLKSHKPVPLTWRNIHASSCPATFGLSAWLCCELREITQKLPYLLASTEQLVDDLRYL